MLCTYLKVSLNVNRVLYFNLIGFFHIQKVTLLLRESKTSRPSFEVGLVRAGYQEQNWSNITGTIELHLKAVSYLNKQKKANKTQAPEKMCWSMLIGWKLLWASKSQERLTTTDFTTKRTKHHKTIKTKKTTRRLHCLDTFHRRKTDLWPLWLIFSTAEKI